MSKSSARFARITLLFLLVLMVSSLLPRTFFALGADVASMKIEEAATSIREAFNATLEAERAGANVSSLLTGLNEAGRLMADAEMTYDAGNASAAFAEASSSFSMAEGVKADAVGLKSSALVNAASVFRFDLAFSSVGAAAFLVVLFFVWRWFKRARFGKTVLGLKPEVASDVEA